MNLKYKAILSAAALGLVVAIASPASADVIFALDNATFVGGGTANGFFTINVYGLVGAHDVVTTSGDAFAGSTYATGMGQPSTSIDVNRDLVTFDLAGYNGYLQLTFADPLFPAQGTTDPIVTGAASFECDSYGTTTGACTKTEREIGSGSAVVPEPISLAVLGSGLLGFGLIRRRPSRRIGDERV